MYTFLPRGPAPTQVGSQTINVAGSCRSAANQRRCGRIVSLSRKDSSLSALVTMSFFALLLQQAYKELIALSAMPVTIGRMAVARYNLDSHPAPLWFRAGVPGRARCASHKSDGPCSTCAARGGVTHYPGRQRCTPSRSFPAIRFVSQRCPEAGYADLAPAVVNVGFERWTCERHLYQL